MGYTFTETILIAAVIGQFFWAHNLKTEITRLKEESQAREIAFIRERNERLCHLHGKIQEQLKSFSPVELDRADRQLKEWAHSELALHQSDPEMHAIDFHIVKQFAQRELDESLGSYVRISRELFLMHLYFGFSDHSGLR